MANELVDQGLRVAGAVAGWKITAIKLVIGGTLALMLVMILAIASIFTAPAQSSTTVWPVPVKQDKAGNYVASGWTIASKFGWRDNPLTGDPEFHDGLDLVAAPDKACPFSLYCPAPSMFDGKVTYVGWDKPNARDPDKVGGGEIVTISNGDDQFQTVMAHLQPYRLHIQLQGRVEDDYGRYSEYRNYQPIGDGPLTPADAKGSITMDCSDDAHFVASSSGVSGISFVYAKAASCTTSVSWGEKGDGWSGWKPDGDTQISWKTPFSKDNILAFFEGEANHRAGDVALRFRAHLRPPPPPPPPSNNDDSDNSNDPNAPGNDPAPPSMGSVRGGQGSVARDGVGAQVLQGTPVPTSAPIVTNTSGDGRPRSCATIGTRYVCTWLLRDIPRTTDTVGASRPSMSAHPLLAAQVVGRGGMAQPDTFVPTQATSVPDILPTPKPLHNPTVPTSGPSTGVTGPSVPKSAPCMVAAAYAIAQQGARYSQGGYLDTDPIDPATGRYYPRTGPNSFDCSGLVWKAYQQAGISLGTTTKTQIYDGVEIPCKLSDLNGASTTCWAPGDIALYFDARVAFHVQMYVGNGNFFGCENYKLGCLLMTHMKTSPYYNGVRMMARRITSDCLGLALDPGVPITTPIIPTVPDDPTMCTPGTPSYGSSYEELPGCGPPVRSDNKVYQLDSTVGFVGVTGETTGPHLHIGLQMRRYDNVWAYTNVCTTDWLAGHKAPSNPSQCWTTMVDPLEFLPRATGGRNVGAGDAILADGAPYQLPPPNYPGSLVYDQPDKEKRGQYWSPYQNGGEYGGGSLWDWLLSWL